MSYRCSNCFNTIPSWANGVCPVCVRIKKDNSRFRTKHRTARQKYKGKLPRKTNKETKSKTKINRSSSKVYKPSKKKTSKKPRNKRKRKYQQSVKEKALNQLEGFNRLHVSIYGRRKYFGELLEEKGVSSVKIQKIKIDDKKLGLFLEMFYKRFGIQITKMYSGNDFRNLKMYYGLDGFHPASDDLIADEIGIKESSLTSRRKMILNFLSSEKGRRAYRNLVYVTFQGL